MRAAPLLLVTLLSTTASALPAGTWVVAIGNNNGDADESTLRFAERDASEMALALRRHSGVSGQRTTLLLGEPAEVARHTLQAITAQLREAEAPAALLVFYSGHADATALHMSGSALPLTELTALVESAPAQVRILIVDACRSGTLTRVKGVRAAPPIAIEAGPEPAPEGTAIITSSAAGESSQESDELRGSFFSHHLINALRGAADRDGDRVVTLAEAYDYTYQQTLRSSGRTLSLQHPTYAIRIRGRQAVVLSRPSDDSGQIARLRLGAQAIYLVAEEREGGPMVAEVQPAREGALIELMPGRYFVQERLPTEYREYSAQLRPGAEVALASLSPRHVAYDRLVRRRGSAAASIHGLTLLGGARGPLLSGAPPSGQLQLGYGLDLRWLSAGARLRGTLYDSNAVDGGLPRRNEELGLGLLVQRFVDVGPISLTFGLLVEGALHVQRFGGQREVADRLALGASFAGFVGLEAPVGRGLSLRVEAGPVAHVLPVARVEDNVAVGTELASPVTWSASGGVVWRL